MTPTDPRAGSSDETRNLPGCPPPAALLALWAPDTDRAELPRSAPGWTAASVASHARRCRSCGAELAAQQEDAAYVARAQTPPADEAPPAADEPVDVPGYTIVREVARGGQGVVYEAVQQSTNRPVAVKVLLRGTLASQRELDRFEREVEIAASLRHPNIVTVYEARALADGRHALVMEFVEGQPLSRWAAWAPRGREGARARVALVRDIARAVQHAHGLGIIHRDLKPGNILVEPAGTPRVLDFGLARRWGGPEADSRTASGHASRRTASMSGMSLAGLFQGTPAYAAPEQFDGEPREIDVRADVYALGVVLHELLTGKSPFAESKGVMAVLLGRKRSGGLPAAGPGASALGLVGVGADLDAIIRRATHAQREHRYATAGAMADDLDAALRGDAVSACGGGLYRARKVVRRHMVTTAIAGLVVASLALVAVQARRHTTVLARERAQLAEALHEAVIGRASALARAGDRAQAERLLWSRLLASDTRPSPSGGIDPAIIDDPAIRRATWALLEVTAPSPCLAARRVRAESKFMRVAADRVEVIGRDGWMREFRLPSLEPVDQPRQVWSSAVDGFVVAGPYLLTSSQGRGAMPAVRHGRGRGLDALGFAGRLPRHGGLARRVVVHHRARRHGRRDPCPA